MHTEFEKEDAEVQAAAIQQEWESFRYQDGLRWSKIQTIAAIEAAFITAVYSAPAKITLPMLIVFAILVFLLVLAICLLAEKDGRDAEYHMLRAEALLPLKVTLGLELPKHVFGIRGHHTMRITMIILNLLNLFVVGELITRYGCA